MKDLKTLVGFFGGLDAGFDVVNAAELFLQTQEEFLQLSFFALGAKFDGSVGKIADVAG